MVDLYLGEGELAWQRLDESWRAFARAQLFRVQTLEVSALTARCRAALASAVAGRRERLAAVDRDARRLERLGAAYATALAMQMRAGAALLRGDQQLAARLLPESERQLVKVDMRWQANASRYVYGKMLGGDEGARLISDAERYFAEENMRNVEGMVAVQLPFAR